MGSQFLNIMKTAIKKLLITCAIVPSMTMAAYGASSVLDMSESSQQPTLIMPESFETDTKAMLEDWYLKNYTVLDYDADNRPQAEVSDDVLLERLASLPNVIEMPLNGPVRNAISFYANRKRQLVENMLGLSLYYMPIFEEALERYGLPDELRYLPVIESALVPTAVSRVGAAGLWQFMPATAKGLGLEINSLVDQRRDPYLSSDAGARYLRQLHNTYNDWSLAIAAYNCGPGNVNKALRRAGEGKHDFWDIYPFLPAETRGYVPAFIAANYIMNFHKDHNISPALARRPIITDTVHVTRRVHFDQISEVMGIPVEEIRALNPQFRQDVIPGDIRPYSLVLPSLQTLAYIANEDSIVNHNATRYSRRGIVEPASGDVSGRDSRGEYYEEEVIKYYTVRKGDTLSKIAKRYGVTVASIRKLNKVGKSVKRGKKLKIKTVERRYKPAPEPGPQTNQDVSSDMNPAATDTLQARHETAAHPADTVVRKDEPAVQPKASAQKEIKKENAEKKQQPKAEKKSKKATTTSYTVRKGDTLGKIAKRHGVTVQQIKKANGMKNDNIRAGQTIKIPAK